jgi:hypothetical protein
VRVDDRRQSFHEFIDEGRRPRSTSSFVRRLVVVLAVGAVVDVTVAVF